MLLLLLPLRAKRLLNLAETVDGGTRIFIVCINGRLEIVELLKAGAEQIICDLAGWTEKDHAVFIGHMKVAESLAAHGAGDYSAPASSEILRTGIICPGKPLKCA